MRRLSVSPVPNLGKTLQSLQGDLTTAAPFQGKYILRRPQNFEKYIPYLALALHGTKVRGRFRKILWPSQNI